ncbi:hypothetical protein SAMN06269185_0767 [Natronoarchaeum philippinense]|uniref:TFIIB-type zinc ribbon-containing protein n=1 Tax=Natronoarchaeum philippinense TaxID=558529 RepID=A0A285N6N2_NATPI|nr:hypothetical protein [Natronoarchaeum philippinense]SNZ05080.1 hypothetical protein SAMN06269185_0767 [Natronoarchaeum philippinense]
MEIRGERECKDCGTRWSYYETGSVSCPNCNSVRSVGVDEERKRHTAGQATLDLTEVRNMIDAAPEDEIADAAIEKCREFVRRTGFIDAGELQSLDDTYLAARELRQVADVVGRAYDPTNDEELYYLSLLRGADRGERPASEEVPSTIREARGLAYADAVDAYRSDLSTWIDDRDDKYPAALGAMATLGDHVKRIKALQGDVDPSEAETLVSAARSLGEAVRWDDEDALARCRDRLDRLSE